VNSFKVFDLIEQENVQVSKDQLAKLLNLLEKEKIIEMEIEEQQKLSDMVNNPKPQAKSQPPSSSTSS
jgi:hypothetical protein